MLDQSFSCDNFKIIYDLENRKGNFDLDFYSKPYIDIIDKIRDLRREIKLEKARNISDDFLLILLNQKEKLEIEKENLLENDLTKFSHEINKDSFSFKLKSFIPAPREKTIYTTDKDAVSYFAMKQLQHNIYRTFKVKQSDRYKLVKQLKLLLEDNFPKIIIRTDIKSFYESVPQYELLKLIENNTLLSPKSKSLIKNLLYNFNKLTNQLQIDKSIRKGIPRGAGVSPYLAELYMRNIDNEIKNLDEISFYGRYVDDIIIIFTPKSNIVTSSYLNEIKSIINNRGLQLSEDLIRPNRSKTFELNLINQNTNKEINFLGYKFVINRDLFSKVKLSDNKKKKYESRIEKSILDYLKEEKYDQKTARKLLVHRISYLTKNTKLHQPKRGMIGIYYSNSLLDKDSTCLDDLDNSLHLIIDRLLINVRHNNLKLKLKKYSFKKGFEEKLFFNINSKKKDIPDIRSAKYKQDKPLMNNFERIVSIWK
ncbi:antiviral reverse transcriptase Drt3a [Flavobacterium panici]|uniref:Reverse transcriptase domain-containing protein n=1 Tax=Flavobacterium panici TaxID=2654843 RepID=A0A9N8P1G7_9FLAO|nr:antiviral reverse transcriptase Drt3a [Flavobacterium panici]CAC9974027.1 hypothetical protein FLAPXU55_01720 [Flavobacterium panici]